LDVKRILLVAKFHQGARAHENVYMVYSPGDGQTSCKVWLSSGKRRHCSNEAKTRNPLKFAGVPKLPNRSQPLVGRSSPYCEDFWRMYCYLTRFSDCRYMPYLRRYSPTNLCDGAQMAIFCVIFVSCISSESRAAHFGPAF